MSHDAHHRYEWNTMPWRKLEVKVFKLQRRIYQATTRGETKQAHRLQRLLATSWSAKSLAVRKVTQENKGKKTAGVDGKSHLTPPQRLKLISTMDLHAPVKPVRRVWIPKPGTPEKRPLGIPMGHAYCISLQRHLGIAVVAPTSMNAIDQLTQYNELGEADQVSSGKNRSESVRITSKCSGLLTSTPTACFSVNDGLVGQTLMAVQSCHARRRYSWPFTS
jgi:N-terminal domain of reverse transcriptase